jgi:hypothetical protein
VDGSSTTYNIVVPQRKLVAEVVRYFLNLKIINRNSEIRVSYREKSGKAVIKRQEKYVEEEFKADDIDKLCTVLESPTLGEVNISTECVHPDKLYHELRKELYGLSKTRPGAEDREYHYSDPTVSILNYGPALWVSMGIYFKEEVEPIKDYEAEGLIFNEEALINNLRGTHFTINFDCGPGFIYEYAAYIVTKLAERFPEIGIDGGIDCAGGFVDGCTYASNLYSYEKITLTTENIADAITYILKEFNIAPQRRAGRYGYDLETCSNLYLYNLHNIYDANDDYLSGVMKIIKKMLGSKVELTPQQYEAFVRRVAVVGIVDSIDFMHNCACCCKVNEEDVILTCVRENGRVRLQFRVEPELREGFVKRLKAGGFDIR